MRSCRGSQGSGSVLLAVGILGATVMPHVIWLHSALMQDRIRPQNDQQARRLMRLTKIDVGIAMAIAGLINVAMLVMAASTFFKSGLHNVESLEGAHKTLVPLLGGASSALFAIALLFSGPVELGGRDARGSGRDAGLHPAADPDRRAPARDDGAGVRRHRPRRRPVADARDQPGRALLRHPVRARAARLFTSQAAS